MNNVHLVSCGWTSLRTLTDAPESSVVPDLDYSIAKYALPLLRFTPLELAAFMDVKTYTLR